MAQMVLRFEVPVDDQWHRIKVPGVRILHVDCRQLDAVEFWALGQPNTGNDRLFRVYGTGQQIDCKTAEWVGTAVRGGLVWHLFEDVEQFRE